MKTYTQKQYDSEKERAYKKGYEVGERDAKWKLMETEEVLMDYALESAEQIKSWNKYGTPMKHNWTDYIFIAILLGIVCAMILNNQPYQF